MLRGIVHYERTHQIWTAFHDDQARAEIDPQWLDNKRWDGVISRHTTPGLVATCKKLKIPLVDLNDVPRFPGVPKIRPDNVAIGHLAAEHFLERGFRHFGFTGFSNDNWSCERRDGFAEALQLAGRKCDIYDVNYPGDVTPAWDLDQISGLSDWLKRLPKPCGVMACFDLRAQQILTATHASLTKQYEALLATEDVTLAFTPEGIRRLAEIAFSVNEKTENIGARRLYTVMEKLLEDISFDAAKSGGKTLTIDPAYVDTRLSELSQSEDLARYVL